MKDIEKKIVAEIAKTKGFGIATLGLRFDRVVLRVTKDLRISAEGSIPTGTTVFLTITAPIRLPAKTALALEKRVVSKIGQRVPQRDLSSTIHGNHVRMRFVEHGSKRAPKLVVFVHNPESSPKRILDLAAEVALP